VSPRAANGRSPRSPKAKRKLTPADAASQVATTAERETMDAAREGAHFCDSADALQAPGGRGGFQ
jgi:hypothetical protein